MYFFFLNNISLLFQFYFYILTVSIALLCVYILCNFYNLIWIVCPQMGKMYRIICKYQEIVDPTLNQNLSTAAPNLIKYKNNIASADEVTIPLAPGNTKNSSIYNIIRWFAGRMGQTTKHHMFQVLFFFIKACKILCKNPFNLIFPFFL